ncbi:MAG: nitroreductase family protein [Dehalococcoidaceae bacterium]|nr:nitroreductase family protein [Dehalococcoidaceae bacterium]
MELNDIIQARRSVRRYRPVLVEREKILQCLEAARLAPSACNGQPWQFIVVDDAELKNRLAGEAFSGIYAGTRFAGRAPVLIALVADPDWLPKIGGAIRKTDFHLIDIGIAGEHFVLKAAELGLGTCWLGWFDETKAKKVLKLPAGKKIEIMLAVGYPQDSPIPPRRRKALGEICTFSSSGQQPQ